MKRRDFLGAMIAAGVLTLLPGPVRAGAKPGSRALVLVHLKGGNDGLNTVIPFGDPLYRRLRPTLALDPKRVLPLDGGLAFHPRLEKLRGLYEKGRLGVVLGAGYPDPSLSHFRSTEIWYTAGGAGQLYTGWAGRLLDRSRGALPGVALEPTAPQSLVGARAMPATVQDFSRFRLPADVVPAVDLYRRAASRPGLRGEVGRLGRSAAEVAATLARLQPARRPEGAGLARDLRLAVALLESDLGIQVLQVAMDGFDTHVGQQGVHDRLLGELDGALAGFQEELEARGLGGRVLTLVFSEFGRRPAENAGGGTDHGTAGPMFLLGGKARPGLHGRQPSLEALEDGNLRHAVDFREVYAAVLRDWMGTDPRPVLGGFRPLDCVG